MHTCSLRCCLRLDPAAPSSPAPLDQAGRDRSAALLKGRVLPHEAAHVLEGRNQRVLRTRGCCGVGAAARAATPAAGKVPRQGGCQAVGCRSTGQLAVVPVAVADADQKRAVNRYGEGVGILVGFLPAALEAPATRYRGDVCSHVGSRVCACVCGWWGGWSGGGGGGAAARPAQQSWPWASSRGADLREDRQGGRPSLPGSTLTRHAGYRQLRLAVEAGGPLVRHSLPLLQLSLHPGPGCACPMERVLERRHAG